MREKLWSFLQTTLRPHRSDDQMVKIADGRALQTCRKSCIETSEFLGEMIGGRYDEDARTYMTSIQAVDRLNQTLHAHYKPLLSLTDQLP